jgi:hypothetical protein
LTSCKRMALASKTARIFSAASCAELLSGWLRENVERVSVMGGWLSGCMGRAAAARGKFGGPQRAFRVAAHAWEAHARGTNCAAGLAHTLLTHPPPPPTRPYPPPHTHGGQGAGGRRPFDRTHCCSACALWARLISAAVALGATSKIALAWFRLMHPPPPPVGCGILVTRAAQARVASAGPGLFWTVATTVLTVWLPPNSWAPHLRATGGSGLRHVGGGERWPAVRGAGGRPGPHCARTDWARRLR